MTVLYNAASHDHSTDLIPFLSYGNNLPSDKAYIEAYKTVFEILKGVFQGPSGYVNFLKQKNASKIDTFLGQLYDDLVDQNKRSYSDYVEQASIDIYDLVLGQERVVLSKLQDNLSDFNKSNKLSKNNKEYLDQILNLIKLGTDSEKAFLYTMIGKVLEGSLSQARKSLGGYFAEKIINVLLEKQNLNVSSQDGSKTATNTDLVVTTEKYTHCIAVQLSTNDRMRLSTDEYRSDSINYLVSFNGCTVSMKGKADISLQRMSTWMKDSIENNKVLPFYVGRDIFIKEIKNTFEKKFLEGIQPYISEPLDLSINPQDILKLLNGIQQDLPNEFSKLKTSMYLALWAHNCTLSFEDFIEKLHK